MQKIRSSEITSENDYLSRRQFMAATGALFSATALAACDAPTSGGNTGTTSTTNSGDVTSVEGGGSVPAIYLPDSLSHSEPFASTDVDEFGESLNTYEAITNYNNYYEFTTNKEGVNSLAENFDPYPWSVEVTGLVNNPKTFGIEDLLANFTQEERIYRLRCVEAWSMVIPWVGFSLGSLLKEVDPKSEAKYVRFETVLRPEQMPGQKSGFIDWPYREGLRVDEAMHPLTIMATGMYGKPLANANGAPLRLVVPWKYGFKSIKGIVKIELTDTMPVSTWMDQAAREYGFYANVNPDVSHPRWSQASEKRIGGGFSRIPTRMFNGYAEEVASLYSDMDLRTNF